MTNLPGEAYASMLHERISAFRGYLDQLYGESSVAASSTARAVAAFQLFTVKLSQQAHIVADGEDDLESALKPLLADLRRVEVVADQLFSRGHAIDVPKSLLSSVSKECKALKLNEYSPVMTFGRPQNFETRITDLRDWMFAALDIVEIPSVSYKLALISIPYLEGTRSLWQPVTLGHELAHIAVDEKQLIEQLNPHTWITDELYQQFDFDHPPSWFTRSVNPRKEIGEVAMSWAREIACDMHTVRRFGPAGFTAMSEFLTSINALNYESASHPPARLRIHCMRRVLRDQSELYNSTLEQWESYGSDTLRGHCSDFAITLATAINSRLFELDEAILLIGADRYDYTCRQAAVQELSEYYVNFVPAVETRESGTVTNIDILNAGWTARSYLETRVPGEHRGEMLLMLDRIIGKALDNLEFIELWIEAGQSRSASAELEDSTERSASLTTPVLEAEKMEPRPRPFPTRGTAGVLSASEIERRIEAGFQGPGVRNSLIVTPRATLVTQGTTLDVRLSNGFIVFKRSSTQVFDALDETQDPRMMQEWVEKRWGGQFVLHPHELVLAATLEYIVIPEDLTAQVGTRSSYGRLGLVSATAVQVHPHFHGCITLELVNHGQMPLSLTPGERIAQLVFHRVDPAAEKPAQKYKYPIGPEFSRITQDKDDFTRLRYLRNKVD